MPCGDVSSSWMLMQRVLKREATPPPLFKQFIEHNLKWAAKDRKAFMNGFMPHFECVVAYFPKK